LAKLNLEIELDWLDENNNIDDVIKNVIIASVAEKVNASIEKEIVKEAIKKINSKTDAILDVKINEIITDFITRGFTEINNWGEEIGETTVLKKLKDKLDNFLTQKVDNRGQEVKYNGKPRIDYIIEQHVNYDLEKKVREAAVVIRKSLEDYVNNELKKQIGENIIQIVGLEKLKGKEEVK